MNVHLDDKTNLLNFEQPENSRENKKNLGEHLNKAINGMIPQLMHPEVMVQTQKVKIIKLINQRRLVQKQQNNDQTSNSDQGTFEMPSSVQKQEKFQITVHVDESKLVNHKFQLSIKNKDGQEVGMFDGQAPGVSSSVSPKIKTV